MPSYSVVFANLLILLVGAGRFELPTPSPPDWCANQAALRSVLAVMRLPPLMRLPMNIAGGKAAIAWGRVCSLRSEEAVAPETVVYDLLRAL